mmetsp:Transcript_36927/g.95635  ORF Transcript_36927/g.95635 Transcript_36927/m.95635 type:complete len:211 (+) Transcript_36927:4166-4798(+)
MKAGKFIVFEGVSPAGKTALPKFLYEEVRRRDLPVHFCQFPDRETQLGQTIDQYLKDPKTPASPMRLNLLFSDARWKTAVIIRDLIRQGIHVICDRYYYSGVFYASARGHMDASAWVTDRQLGLPEPDMVYVMDVPPDQSKHYKNRGGDRVDVQYTVRVDVEYAVRQKLLETCIRSFHWKLLSFADDHPPHEILPELLEDLHLETTSSHM